MMNMLVMFAWVLVAFVLQTTFAPAFFSSLASVTDLSFLSGRTADFALITLIYFTFHRDLKGCFIWAALFGIVAASFGLAWKGAAAAGYFSVVIAGTIARRQVVLEGMRAAMLLAGVLSLFEGIIHYKTGHLFSRVAFSWWSQAGGMFAQACINALLAPAVYFFLSTLDGWTGGRPARDGRSLLSAL